MNQPMKYVHSKSCTFLNSLFERLISELSANSVLYIQRSNFFEKRAIFSTLAHDHLDCDDGQNSQNEYKLPFPPNGTWDVVFGDFPFGVKTQTKWRDLALDHISEALRVVSDEGMGIFLLASYWGAFESSDLRSLVANDGFYVNSVVNLPSGILEPKTSIRPILVFISRFETKFEFFVEFEDMEPTETQLRSVVQTIVSQLVPNEPHPKTTHTQIYRMVPPSSLFELPLGQSTGKSEENIKRGIFSLPRRFKGFEAWKIRKSISQLNTDYTEYSMVHLENLANEINFKVDEFRYSKNAIYIPLIGKLQCETNLDACKQGNRNLCQVIVNENKILPMFLLHYLNSELGHKILTLKQAESSSLIIRRINRARIRSIEVALPPISVQNQIIDTIEKLKSATVEIQAIQTNLSLNPISSKSERGKLDRIMSALGELTAADEIKSLIRNDESKRLEFKETFNWDVYTKQKNSELEMAVIKTIGGFLNSVGGDLLIGVNDAGAITGLDIEINKLHKGSRDKFVRHIKDKLKTYIGAEFFQFFESGLVEVGEELVMRISCQQSDREVFVNSNEFYVRTDPATERLEGKEQIDYIRARFPN